MSYEKVEAISKFLQSQTTIRPKVGIIAGSGLGGLADRLEAKVELPYHVIPDFPVSTGTDRERERVSVKLCLCSRSREIAAFDAQRRASLFPSCVAGSRGSWGITGLWKAGRSA